MTQDMIASKSGQASVSPESLRIFGRLVRSQLRAREDAPGADEIDDNLLMSAARIDWDLLAAQSDAVITGNAAAPRHLMLIQALLAERDALERDIETNAARHRQQLAALRPPEAGPATASIAASSAPLDPDLPAFTRSGRLNRAKAKSMLAAARSAFRARDWDSASRLYAELLSYQPRRPGAWKQYGHALKERGDLTMAERAYFRSLSLAPGDPDTVLHLAHLVKLQGRWDEAADLFRGGLKMRPDHRGLREGLGDLGHALPPETTPPPPAARPGRIQAWLIARRVKAAQAAMKAAKWSEGARRYQALVAAHPDNVRYHLQLGHALKEAGRLSEAERAYRRGLELEPLNSDAWLHLGHALKLRGAFDEMRRCYEAALRYNPDNQDARREL